MYLYGGNRPRGETQVNLPFSCGLGLVDFAPRPPPKNTIDNIFKKGNEIKNL